jgi:hypothetical protein
MDRKRPPANFPGVPAKRNAIPSSVGLDLNSSEFEFPAIVQPTEVPTICTDANPEANEVWNIPTSNSRGNSNPPPPSYNQPTRQAIHDPRLTNSHHRGYSQPQISHRAISDQPDQQRISQGYSNRNQSQNQSYQKS